ncbi:MAG: DUF1073 domain-containing protein [Acidaminococcaceae bacterium]|nr:DUF1073 domain-containing protein [Acidaminococcaceae bacterium]
MARFNDLINTETNEHHRRIFETIAKHESAGAETEDGYKEIALDASELALIRDEAAAIVQDARPGTQSATEMRENMIKDYGSRIEAMQKEAEARAKMAKEPGIVQDGYYNPVSGIGTIIDPGMQTESFIPVSITPTEATSYYANAGLPARVIDKKAGVLALDGVHFECDAFTPEDLQKLEARAQECGFNEAYSQSITQALIFGGAVTYPAIDGDNPIRTQKGIDELLTEIRKEKDFIRYWITADRWNCVFVPDYNITAQDYLYAKSLFIPLGGVRVNTERMAMVRPKRLPFWGAIQQMGWATSDFEGWIKDYEAYQIMKMSLPIMAQQSSLMYHAIPADGLIIENGPEFAKTFFKENEAQMREWSMLHPKAINSVGEIKILERTYSGFRDLINESRLAFCASCGLAESVLFQEKATGLASDNQDDIKLKQSETARLLFNQVEPAFKNCIKLLVADTFGKNSEQYQHADEVHIKRDDGVVMTDQEKAQIGQSLAQTAGAFVSMGAPLTTALKAADKLMKDGELDEKIMDELTAGEAEGMDEEMWNMTQAGRDMQQPEEAGGFDNGEQW